MSPLEDLALYVQSSAPLVYLVTWEEERAVELLGEVAQRSGRRLHVWTQTRGLGSARGARWDAALADPLAALEHVAASDERAVYALLDFHPFLASHAATRKLKDAALRIQGAGKTVVLVSPVLALPVELAKEAAVVDLALPRPEELAAALAGFLARAEKNGAPVALGEGDRERLVRAAQGLTLKELAGSLARAVAAHGAIDGRTADCVQRDKRQVVRKTGALESVEVSEGLASVGGHDALKRWLETRANAFGERARRYGLPPPKGLLLVGVQGSGKSLCARAAAASWRLPLLRLDVGALFAGTVGGSEGNARQALAVADAVAPCVLWLDEIDKGFAGVTGGAADAGTAARVFATFLTWLQEKTSAVFVIATANAIDALPPELLRKGRFDEVFFLDLPGPAERLEVARIHLAARARDPADFDLEAIAEASDGHAGAEIEQAIVAGMFHAFDEGRALETRDVLRALRDAVPLSRTMGEQVESLRRWAATRARPASASGAALGRRVSV